MWELDEHLRAGAGLAQRLEHFGYLIHRDYIGHHRLRFDAACRQRANCLLELRSGVPEYEVDTHFLENALHRHDLVGLHTDANHDHLPAGTDHVDRGIERALHTDTFEDEVRPMYSHFAHRVIGSLFVGIDHDVGAELARQFGTPRRDFRDDDLGALPFRPCERRKPDRPRAHHDRG